MMKELHTLDHSVAITDDEEEIVEVWTTPQTNPKTFRERVKSLMISGLSQSEAEQIASTEPTPKLSATHRYIIPLRAMKYPMKRLSKHNLFTRGGERKFFAFLIFQT